MDDSKVKDFLKKIGQIESAGGKYTNHKVLDHGMHEGQSAYGTYGLMPNTIDEIAASSKDPSVSQLVDMDEAQKKAYLKKHPEVEQTLAQTLASKVLANQSGDEQKAAYAWYNGHNLTPDKIEARDYQNSDYVKKYSKLADLIARKPAAKNPLDMSGTPEGDKVIAALGGKPTPADAAAYAGTGAGFGGTSDTLALNNSQRSQLESAFQDLVRAPASAPAQSLYSDMGGASKASPIADPSIVAPKIVNSTPVQQPAMPNFGEINKLIAAYNKGKK